MYNHVFWCLSLVTPDNLFNLLCRAFTNADNYPTLDHIFSLLFDKLFAEETSDSSLLGISAIAKLKLPTDIAVSLVMI